MTSQINPFLKTYGKVFGLLATMAFGALFPQAHVFSFLIQYLLMGMLFFSTGALAPGVTIDKATYRMWAADAGIKWNGLAVNAQYFMRWLRDFEADGPLPLDSTFDRGAEVTAS